MDPVTVSFGKDAQGCFATVEGVREQVEDAIALAICEAAASIGKGVYRSSAAEKLLMIFDSDVTDQEARQFTLDGLRGYGYRVTQRHHIQAQFTNRVRLHPL